MKNWIKQLVPYVDGLLLPLIYISAFLLKNIRKIGVAKLPLCKKALLDVGVFPINNHYYEPQFDMRDIKKDFAAERNLPGITWNTELQLDMLKEFCFSDELILFPVQKTNELKFYFNNSSFESGDAEYWYQIIRLKKPKRIFEIGSGNSTLMAISAIRKNQEENPEYTCKHVCIEPYEAPWLERCELTVVREKVEDLPINFFAELESDDILFIDSSHVIKPEGDVLFEYLEVLPSLSKGVIVHIHDIFSPRNYLSQWLNVEVRLWNEQYLLEAFLSHNKSWQIIGALNYLHHHHYEKLKLVCPFLTPDREPGSFYIQRIA